MLKAGKKGLYVFDRDGHHYQVQPPCVLDFYVHESHQRKGLGKQLFEHMLQVSTLNLRVLTPVVLEIKLVLELYGKTTCGYLSLDLSMNYIFLKRTC